VWLGWGVGGRAEFASCGIPHLTPTLSAPEGGQGEFGSSPRQR
jgi:hypothetical protein